MIDTRHLIATLIASALTAGCYGEGRVSYVATTPDLAYVEPGVYVVADYDDPVFYADHVYWRFQDGVWYRSRSYRGGWAVTAHVPVAVRRIDHPASYRHYHAPHRDHRNADREHRAAHRDHREARRDHRHR
jgi:hypothetical protein